MGVAGDVQQRIYVSYAWKAEQQTALVDQLEAACERRGIGLIRDNKAIKYGDSIRDYMQALGASGLNVGWISAAHPPYRLSSLNVNPYFASNCLSR